MVFGLSVYKVLQKANAELNIHRENFCDSSKIRETFLSLNFIHLLYHILSLDNIDNELTSLAVASFVQCNNPCRIFLSIVSVSGKVHNDRDYKTYVFIV